MSNSDIEKGAGASTYVQQPQAAHVEHGTSFLPTYEEHLNENLRKFGQPDGQDNAKAFDLIEEPKAGRRKCMKREYLILAIIFSLICAIALPLGLVFIIRNHHSDQEVRENNSTTSIQTKTDFVSLQPSTLQTRQAETSSSITPLTAVLTSTVVPVTVYVTMTPTPEASTPTVTVTRTQSLSTSKSETTTSDASTATVTTLSIVTATPSTSTSTSTSTTSTLSKFSLDPALIPSIQSELAEASSSRAAEETKATATTKKETTTATVVSATTIEPPTTASKAIQTAHPRFGFCGVAGSNC
ncbi:hypothetical protein CKM354_000428000 [Cercospora kikuchii]|uniref:Uncharacterized protein n=1 Tax=Cercospora kikuchii TaxID=84275 RepID=A0A9P3CJK2_9PEZI|nr:uncharacterized protein CKM354_000428000 [Cercospora kikuchii]GIZ40960.1 hypothetical protein CKM354_000428000 [Cercospora kikuchii]